MDDVREDNLQEGAACDWPAWRVPVRVRLMVTEPHPCSYLPGRMSTTRALMAGRVDPEIYHQFMDAGFRRSGRVLYQPICAGCRACLPIRVPVADFRPNKSQRRVWRRNGDVQVTVHEPQPTPEKFEVYQRYQTQWHDGAMAGGWEDFVSFLYSSPVQTIEMDYRLADGRLVAVGICDVSRQSLSSVYFYFDPADARRGLGTYGVLGEIELARQMGIGHYYLGYWIAGCGTMQYKADFRPHEILLPTGDWQRVA